MERARRPACRFALGIGWLPGGSTTDIQLTAKTPQADSARDRQLNVLAVYDIVECETSGAEGTRKLIGVAPWYLDFNPIKGNVLRWLGSGEVCTDHLSLICRPEDAERVAAVDCRCTDDLP